MKKKKIIIGALLCAVIMMAIGYAAFATRLSINGTSNIASNWKVVFTEILQVNKSAGVTEKSVPTASGTTATFDVGLTSPGDVIEYRITVANQGSIDAIIESINASDTGSDAIVFEITNIKVGDVLLKNATTTFNVKISYKDSIVSQPNILVNKLTVNINYAQNVGQSITPSNPVIETQTLAARILNDNNVQSDANIDFSKASSATNGQGLYYTNTNTENNKTTYYFRGNVENNFVQFGSVLGGGVCVHSGVEYPDVPQSECHGTGFCIGDGFAYGYTGICEGHTVLEGAPTWQQTPTLWRIIRINEDGSVRLIKTENTGEYIEYNSVYDNGYMYGDNNAYDSVIKEYLDDWYVSNLKINYSQYLADSGFCNDRSVTSVDDDYTNYSTYNRTEVLKKPQFKCPNESNDLFTLTTSSKGNKKLTNPIGMITVDELIYAGRSGYTASGYLSEFETWTMSPIRGGGLVHIYSNDYLWGERNPNEPTYVHPVINLKGDLQVKLEGTGAPGSATNPYIVVTN